MPNQSSQSITVKNQGGYELTLNTEKSGDFYITAVNRFGIPLLEKETDKVKKIRMMVLLNTPLEVSLLLSINSSNAAKKNDVVSKLVYDKFLKLSMTKSRMGIDIDFRNGEPVIIFGLGLIGGGFWKRAGGVAVGATLVVVSGYVIILSGGLASAPIAAIAGTFGTSATTVAAAATTVVQAGISSAGYRTMHYALSTDEKDYSASGLIKSGAKGAMVGGGEEITSFTFGTNVFGNTIGNIVVDIAAEVTITLASNIYEAVTEWNIEILKRDINKNIWITAIANRVAAAVANGVSKKFKIFFNQTDDKEELDDNPTLKETTKLTKAIVAALDPLEKALATILYNALHIFTDENNKHDFFSGVENPQEIIKNMISGSVVNLMSNVGKDILNRIQEKISAAPDNAATETKQTPVAAGHAAPVQAAQPVNSDIKKDSSTAPTSPAQFVQFSKEQSFWKARDTAPVVKPQAPTTSATGKPLKPGG